MEKKEGSFHKLSLSYRRQLTIIRRVLLFRVVARESWDNFVHCCICCVVSYNYCYRLCNVTRFVMCKYLFIVYVHVADTFGEREKRNARVKRQNTPYYRVVKDVT